MLIMRIIAAVAREVGSLRVRIAIACAIFWPFVANGCQIAAFPGAEGAGMYSVGGRGEVVYEVTNLDDNGPGSLRAACEADGPRTVVFRVSGTIQLKSRLTIRNPYITIAGQTAPGDGICIRGGEVMIRGTHDVIVRYVRFRSGNEGDSLDVMYGCRDVIIDHCSMSWGKDEAASFWGNQNVTVQWCMIGEGLFPHSCGGIFGTDSSYHHNLIYSNGTRNPRFAYGRQAEDAARDFRNNVIYNWGYTSSISSTGEKANMVNNYYKAGPGRKRDEPLSHQIISIHGGSSLYVAGNYVWGFPKVTADNWAGGIQGDACDRMDKPFPALVVSMQSAEEAYELVLADAGATRPKRDSVDQLAIHHVRTGSYTFTGTKNGIAYFGIPNSVEDAGGWPELRTYGVLIDTDRDGMPDEWEKSKGLDPSDPEDRNGYGLDGSYTNLEVYLNSLASDPYKAMMAAPDRTGMASGL
jgi:pectate lyase